MSRVSALPSSMVWHIVRKDLKLLWPLALVGLVENSLLLPLRFQSASYHDQDILAALLTIGLLLVAVAVIMLAVQADAIPGIDQDWLTRPIKRLDLLVAKLLAVALWVQGPMALSNLIQVLAEGFALGQAVRVTLLSALEVALMFTLPVMTIAALTRNLTEALLGALAVFLGLIALYLLLTRGLHWSRVTDDTGIAWIYDLASHTVLLLTTLGTLSWQYFRRNTRMARIVFVGGLALFMLLPGLPWEPAFALQRWLSATPDAGRNIAVVFDPSLAATDDADNVAGPDNRLLVDRTAGTKMVAATDEKKQRGTEQMVLAIPLRFSGMPPGTILHADRTVVRLYAADGKLVYRGIGNIFDVLPPGEDSSGRGGTLHQTIDLPAARYRSLLDAPLRLELEYSFTLLRSHALPALPASGRGTLPEVGHCVSASAAKGETTVACRVAGETPACVSMAWEDLPAPVAFACSLSYRPHFLRFGSDPIDQLELKLNAPAAPAPEKRLVLSVFEAQTHFSRQLSVPAIRLPNFRVNPPG